MYTKKICFALYGFVSQFSQKDLSLPEVRAVLGRPLVREVNER